MKVGRITKLTPQVQSLICEALESGITVTDACALVGVSARAFHLWCAEGREAAAILEQNPGEELDDRQALTLQFFRAQARARSFCVKEMMDVIASAARDPSRKDDWRAAEAYVKLTAGDRYGERRLVHAGDPIAPIHMTHAAMEADALAKLRADPEADAALKVISDKQTAIMLGDDDKGKA